MILVSDAWLTTISSRDLYFSHGGFIYYKLNIGQKIYIYQYLNIRYFSYQMVNNSFTSLPNFDVVIVSLIIIRHYAHAFLEESFE